MLNDKEVDTRCPHCLKTHDRASCLDNDATPKDGDFTLCVQCGEWAIFDRKAPGRLRVPTVDEYMHIGQSDLMRKARAAWVQMKENTAKKKAESPPPPKMPTPLKDGFDDLMKDVYQSIPNVPERVRKEFRRHFFCGAVIAMKYLSGAIGKDGAVNTREMLKRYNDIVAEERQFKTDINANRA